MRLTSSRDAKGRRAGLLTVILMVIAWPGAGVQEPSHSPAPPATGEAADEPAGQEVLGRGAAFQIDTRDEQTIQVPAGTRILRQPHLGAGVLENLPAPAELTIQERRGPWVRVRHQALLGWILSTDPGAGTETPGGAAPLAFHPDEERLGRARTLLGERERRGTLGPYILYTDLPEPALREELGRLASGLEATYRERFGLDPKPVGSETVILFTREEDYRAFEALEPGLTGAETRGHTTQGLAVTFVGDRPLDEVRRILVHELTHLLGRSAAGSDMPAWLEEGLAEDLALSRVDEAGRIVPGSLAGAVRRRVIRPAGGRSFGSIQKFDVTGPVGSLSSLLLQWHDPRRPPLDEFVELALVDFLEPELRSLYYSQSAFLVRYLLDGPKPASRESFRGYLRAVAGGDRGDTGALWERLRIGPSEVEDGLQAWLAAEARSHGLPLMAPGSRSRSR